MKKIIFLFLESTLFIGGILFLDTCKPSGIQLYESVVRISNDTIEFKSGSKILIDSISNFQIESLEMLGKIWGMMKYYHPMVSKGNYNWDYELFRVMPIVLNSGNIKNRNATLRQWINSFGRLPNVREELIIDSSLVKMDRDFRWIENKNLLDKNLSNLLKRLKNVQIDSINFYIDFSFYKGIPMLKNEKSYSEMIYPDVGYRLLALYRYWNIIQYFFPYRYLIGEDWDKVLSEFIPIFINAKDATEYQIALLKLITRINDTHANIYQTEIALDTVRGIRCLPIEVTFIENCAVVTDFFDKEWAKKTKLKKGDVIAKIDGKCVVKIIKERRIITPASNEAVRLRNITHDLLRSSDTVMHLEYTHNESNRSEIVKTIPYRHFHVEKMLAKKASFKTLSDNIGYIYMGTLTRDSVAFIMKKLNETKGIIIDLRCYPVDFPIYELGGYLFSQPTPFVISTRSVTTPGQFIYSDTLKVGVKNYYYYKGKIVILINEITQSSAEFHAMALRIAPNAIIIGSQTAGADGNIFFIPLPGSIQTCISGIGVYYPNGRETQRIGIVPDIEVKPTIKGIKEGKDEVLERAIEWIKEK